MGVSRQIRPRPKAPKAAKKLPGSSPGGSRINRKWRKQFQRLVELRDYLLQRQREHANDAMEERPTFSMHMADAGTDSFDRDLALGMLSHEQDAVYEIEEALNRIRNATYGICELTGRRIPAARLDAVPWARFTAAAEASLEKKGGFQRARLGSH